MARIPARPPIHPRAVALPGRVAHALGTAVLGAAVLGASLGLGGCARLQRAPMVAVHYAAHQLCSAAFLGGQDPQAYWREGIAPELLPVSWAISWRVKRGGDPAGNRVAAAFWPFGRSEAADRGAIGCQIIHTPGPEPAIAAPRDLPPALLPPALPAAQDALARRLAPALAPVLDAAFAENASAPYRHTKAVLVLWHGHIIAERYAPGILPQTRLAGWSMTKSVTNALLGILVRQGRLDMNAPAPVRAWADPHDPRHAITPALLLRMASGLGFGQSLTSDWRSAFDPSSQMEFDMPDMAQAAAAAALAAPPGTAWRYSNGNLMILSAIIRDAAGGGGAVVNDWMHRNLFAPLGMASAVMEQDGAGTPLGASHLWASARDWARFGYLYAHDGVVGGVRILPKGWVDFSASLTPGSAAYGYGAGFWTNRGDAPGPRARRKDGMPPDSFMARGSLGQAMIISPAEDLVILRMGLSQTRMGEIDGILHLVAGVRAVLRGTPDPDQNGMARPS